MATKDKSLIPIGPFVRIALLHWYHELAVSIIDFSIIDPSWKYRDVQSHQFIEQMLVYVKYMSVSGLVDQFQETAD